jgi:LuxR family transcriptional regulator
MSELHTGDLVGALAGAGSADELRTLVASAARELGFDYCAYGMRAPLPMSNPRVHMFSNYPTAWQQRYAQENYLASDPTVAQALRSVLPTVWDESLFSPNPGFWEEARAYGLNVGWAQSSCDAQGWVGMLTLARSHEALSAPELRHKSAHMSWLAHAAHAAMARMLASRLPQAPALTTREAEMLRWTADGKTSGEIAQFTGIAERTVNFHLNNAVDKLGVANKTAAAVKAAMLRLL